MMPAMLPVLAINSAKMFNFNWSGVFSESKVRAKGVELSMHVLRYQKPETRTHHHPAIKAPGTNSDNDVAADTLLLPPTMKQSVCADTCCAGLCCSTEGASLGVHTRRMLY